MKDITQICYMRLCNGVHEKKNQHHIKDIADSRLI